MDVEKGVSEKIKEMMDTCSIFDLYTSVSHPVSHPLSSRSLNRHTLNGMKKSKKYRYILSTIIH